MPPVTFKEIITFSSEDQKFPADNLLRPDLAKKWKCCQNCKDKQSSVTIRLDKLTHIRSIDIGNEGSAFVEVLAAREGKDFQVILVASSFTTPLEARNEKDLSRVRMFGPEKLAKDAATEKWDRIKVVCSQPFNKNLQYGLSFIKIIAPGSSNESESDKAPIVKKLGSFIVKDEDEEEQSLAIGSFFAKRKEKPESPSTGAAAIRAAAASIPTASPINPLKRKSLDEDNHCSSKKNRSDSKSSDYSSSSKSRYDCGSKKSKTDHSYRSSSPKDKSSSVNKEKEQRTSSNEHHKSVSNKDRNNKDKSSKSDSSSSRPSNSNDKSSSESKKSKDNSSSKVKKHRPFKKLMEDVVFVMSGYQNPLRSQLRDKMVEMGAQYKGDWDRDSTHLICAYTNTPKYKAVKGKGKIVSEKWVEDSYKNKKRYPCRRYDLEKKSNDDSEEEIWANEILPKDESSTSSIKEEKGSYDGDTSEASVDTDEEIETLLKEKDKTSPKKEQRENGKDDSSSDVYDDDTDVEDDTEPIERKDTSSLTLPKLQSYFSGKMFYIHGTKMNEDLKKQINRYIIAYEGKMSDYMSTEISFVITEDKWDDQFDEALNENPNLQFVRPQWIWKCCDKQNLIPHQPYLIIPSSE